MELQEWTAALTEAIGNVALGILDYLPSVLGAIVLLVVGWGVARLLRYATRQIFERVLRRLASSRPMDTRVQQPSTYSNAPLLASRIVFWIVVLFFVIAAAEVLQLEVVSGLLAGVTTYLPRLIVGLLILFVGLWLAEFTRAFLTRVSKRGGIERGALIGRLGQILVLLVVFTLAIGHVGINNTLLVALVATLLNGVPRGIIALPEYLLFRVMRAYFTLESMLSILIDTKAENLEQATKMNIEKPGSIRVA